MTRATSVAVDIWLPINEQFSKRLSSLVKERVRVLAYGGDGTISSVASIVAHTDSVMVPLPGGTLNHFSKDLGVPQELGDALSQINSWNEQKIDIASVNGYYFINNSSVGVYARSLGTRDQLSGKVSKWPAAIWATAKELIKFRTYKIKFDKTWQRTPLMFVGNNHYSLSAGRLGLRSKLNGAKISIYIAKASSLSSMLGIGLGILVGKKADLIERKTTETTVSFKVKTVTVSVDGEKIRLRTPLEYKIHAGELIVCVPKQ